MTAKSIHVTPTSELGETSEKTIDEYSSVMSRDGISSGPSLPPWPYINHRPRALSSTNMAAPVPIITLNNGVNMPVIGNYRSLFFNPY